MRQFLVGDPGSDHECLSDRLLAVTLAPGEDHVHVARARVGDHRVIVVTLRDDVGLDLGFLEDRRAAVAQRLQSDGDFLGGDRAVVGDTDPLAPRLEPGPALPVCFGLAFELIGGAEDSVSPARRLGATAPRLRCSRSCSTAFLTWKPRASGLA